MAPAALSGTPKGCAFEGGQQGRVGREGCVHMEVDTAHKGHQGSCLYPHSSSMLGAWHGAAYPSDSIVHPGLVGESTVTALVRNHPDPGAERALSRGVHHTLDQLSC